MSSYSYDYVLINDRRWCMHPIQDYTAYEHDIENYLDLCKYCNNFKKRSEFPHLILNPMYLINSCHYEGSRCDMCLDCFNKNKIVRQRNKKA